MWTIVEDILPSSDSYLVLFVFCVILPIAIPVIPVTISCIISTRFLNHSKQHLLGSMKGKTTTTPAKQPRGMTTQKSRDNVTTTTTQSRDKNTRAATTTILLVTMLYLLFNVPVAIYLIIELIDLTMENELGIFSWDTIYIRLFLTIFSVSINAAVNPIVYFYRIKSFKEYSINVKNVGKSMVRQASMVFNREASRGDMFSKVPSRTDLLNREASRADLLNREHSRGDMFSKVPSRTDLLNREASKGDMTVQAIHKVRSGV